MRGPGGAGLPVGSCDVASGGPFQELLARGLLRTGHGVGGRRKGLASWSRGHVPDPSSLRGHGALLESGVGEMAGSSGGAPASSRRGGAHFPRRSGPGAGES